MVSKYIQFLFCFALTSSSAFATDAFVATPKTKMGEDIAKNFSPVFSKIEQKHFKRNGIKQHCSIGHNSSTVD